MICPECKKDNPASTVFCIFCGTPIIGARKSDTKPTQESTPQDHSPSFDDQLARLTQIVLGLTARVSSLERSVDPTRSIDTPNIVASQERGAPAREGTESLHKRPSPHGTSPVRNLFPRWPFEWERIIGLNWLAIIGATALALGILFFLTLAIENNWIGVNGRIILGLATGIILVGTGEYTHHRYPQWAQAVLGGGIGILYISIYAAFGFYNLIDPVFALGFLTLLVFLNGILAIRHEAPATALIGILLAFVTPILLAPDLPNPVAIMSYLIVVDLGILGISTFRNWQWFTLLGLIATYLVTTINYATIADQSMISDYLLLFQGSLTLIFLIFVGATTLFHILWKRSPGRLDLLLMILNGIAYYALSLQILWESYQTWLGLFTLALALFYGLLTYITVRNPQVSPRLSIFGMILAVTFLTLAMPLQLTGSWITVAWATQGAITIWLGFLFASRVTRTIGLGLFSIAGFRLLVFDTFIGFDGAHSLGNEGFQLFLNSRFPTFIFVIAAIYLGAYLYHRRKHELSNPEPFIAPILVVQANFFTLWALSAEIVSYFGTRNPTANLGGYTQDTALMLALTGIWALHSLFLITISLQRRSPIPRWAGLSLLAVVTIKLVFVDPLIIQIDPSSFRALVNFPFLTAFLTTVVLFLASLLYWREKGTLSQAERYIPHLLLITANLIALWTISVEFIRFFDNRAIVLQTNLGDAKHLSLTIFWAIYAMSIVITGILKDQRFIRGAGILILMIPVTKLFVFDVFLLGLEYRVSAFVSLGLLLLATGLAYNRYNDRIRGFFFGTDS